MDIIVCVKAVLDPETVPRYIVSGVSGVGLDGQNKKIVSVGIKTVISPFDELSAEAALRIKDKVGSGVTITAVSMGNTQDSTDALRRVLSMGLDRGVLLKDEAFEDANDLVTAHVLAAAVKKIGHFDLILCGRQAADVDSGVVGSGLAELLGIPSVTIAKDIQVHGNTAMVERVTMEEVEEIDVPLPALVTVSNELGEPRFPKVRDILEAKRKQIPIWSAKDLGIAADELAGYKERLKLDKLSIVETLGQCEFMDGASPDDLAANLLRKLRDEGLIRS